MLEQRLKGPSVPQTVQSEADTEAIISDLSSQASLDMEDIVLGVQKLNTETQQEISIPNICEKWAEKHGQELAAGMQKGLKKLEAAMV